MNGKATKNFRISGVFTKPPIISITSPTHIIVKSTSRKSNLYRDGLENIFATILPISVRTLNDIFLSIILKDDPCPRLKRFYTHFVSIQV